MTTKHRVGEKVRVTVEGVITEVDGASGEHIEIMYAFSERLKGACGVLVGAVAVKIESLESGAAVTAEGSLKLGDVWKDNDGDNWRVTADADGALGLALGNGNGWDRWAFVDEQYGPLTFVKHADSASVAANLKLGDVWRDSDEDNWHVIASSDGGFELQHGSLLRTWAFVTEQFGPLALVSSAS